MALTPRAILSGLEFCSSSLLSSRHHLGFSQNITLAPNRAQIISKESARVFRRPINLTEKVSPSSPHNNPCSIPAQNRGASCKRNMSSSFHLYVHPHPPALENVKCFHLQHVDHEFDHENPGLLRCLSEAGSKSSNCSAPSVAPPRCAKL